MNATEIVRQWTAALKEILQEPADGLHAHQVKALAAISFGMALSGHCDSGHVSVAVPGRAKAASVRRRMERLLCNRRLPAARSMALLARSVMARWGGRPLILILDETPNGEDLRCLRVSVAYRKRTVPLAWSCYRTDAPPQPMPKLIWTLLRRVGRCLPPHASVTFLADRGLSWPTVLDCCVGLGWHYVLRVQHTTRLLLADGTEKRLDELAPRPGCHWLGRGQVFKKAGWREANVVATWEPRCKQAWLLVTDLHASFARCRGYCKRTWCEQTHRDDKSHGFQWQTSCVKQPAHVQRLMLALALATLLALSLGTWVLRQGLRRVLESRGRRTLSIFQMGLRWLTAAVTQDRPIDCRIHLMPP
jgi:hypothetical protein